MADNSASKDNNSDENYFKVLIATDIHLGYGETSEILGKRKVNKWFQFYLFQHVRKFYAADDSFNSFEEILQIANSRDVDFILLGGDLFHEATPSPNSLNK